MTETERQNWNDALADLCSAVEEEQEKYKKDNGRYIRFDDLPSWYVPSELDSVRVTEYKAKEGVGWEIHAEATDSEGVTHRRVYHCVGPMDRDTKWSEVTELTV